MTRDRPPHRLVIRDVVARPVVVPLARPLRTASGTIASAPLVLIDCRMAEGVVGSSYIFAYTPAALGALCRLVTEIGAELAGMAAAPHDLMRHFDRRFRLLGWQGLVGMAVSGIDMAVWDALGRASGEPVSALLGAAPRPIPAYDSHGKIDPRTDLDVLETSVRRGFKAVKFKLGEGSRADDVACVSAVREALGRDIEIMVDFNQALDPVEAVLRIRALEPYDLRWAEEPVRAEDLAGHAAIRRSVSCPVQTGENWWFPRGMAAALAAEACDYAMPDLMKIGGVTGWLEAAALAHAASVPMSSHLFVEASAHVLAATPTVHYLEHLDLAGAIRAEPILLEDGAVTARGPGLGLGWAEDAVAAFAVAP